jgi:hypothetical protein
MSIDSSAKSLFGTHLSPNLAQESSLKEFREFVDMQDGMQVGGGGHP